MNWEIAGIGALYVESRMNLPRNHCVIRDHGLLGLYPGPTPNDTAKGIALEFGPGDDIAASFAERSQSLTLWLSTPPLVEPTK